MIMRCVLYVKEALKMAQKQSVSKYALLIVNGNCSTYPICFIFIILVVILWYINSIS